MLQSLVDQHKAGNSNSEKIGIQLPKDVKKKVRERVRSLENETMDSLETKTRMSRSRSIGSGDEGSKKEDSWESVKDQPSCAICGMVFSTEGKLNTHIKYSSVHISNLKKLDTAERAASPSMKKLAEGVLDKEGGIANYQLYYTGNKNYWRSQDNLDIAIYMHVGTNCIEVIAFDAKADYEYPRIYLDEAKIVSMITEKVIWDKVDEVAKSHNKEKFKKGILPPRDIMFAEEKRRSVSTFIMQRLKLSLDGKPPPQAKSLHAGNLVKATHELLMKQDTHFKRLGVHSPRVSMQKQVFYVPEMNDSEVEVDFANPPDKVRPVQLQRRRHSTDQEIKDAMQSIEQMQSDIRGMTQAAETIANKVHMGIEAFHNALKDRSSLIKSYSKPRQRWIFAINRVLLQLLVKRVTLRLLSFGDKYYTLPPGVEL